MSDLIKQKIKNGEGMLKVEILGWITAQEYDRLTDEKTNPDNFQEIKKYKIEHKPIKADYDLDGDKLKLKEEKLNKTE